MLELYLDRIIPWSVVLPISVGILYYPKLQNSSRLILLYTIAAAVCNVIAVYLARHFHNNMPMFHLYAIVEFILCALFFREILKGSRFVQFIPVIIAAFTVFSILNCCFIQSIQTFNSYPRTLSAGITILFSLVFMYRSLDPYSRKADRSPSALFISIGLFLYFSGSLLLFFFGTMLNNSHSAAQIGWSIHASLILVMYVLFAIAFLKTPQRT